MNQAKRACQELRTYVFRHNGGQEQRDTIYAHISAIEQAIDELEQVNAVTRAADGARRLGLTFSTPLLQDVDENFSRPLLEVGFDMGVEAALAEVLKTEVLKTEGRTLPSDHVENPFRSASTVITEPTPPLRPFQAAALEETLASKGAYAPIVPTGSVVNVMFPRIDAPLMVKVPRPESCQCGTEYTCKIACTCDGYPHEGGCHHGQGWDEAPPATEFMIMRVTTERRLERP